MNKKKRETISKLLRVNPELAISVVNSLSKKDRGKIKNFLITNQKYIEIVFDKENFIKRIIPIERVLEQHLYKKIFIKNNYCKRV